MKQVTTTTKVLPSLLQLAYYRLLPPCCCPTFLTASQHWAACV